MSSPRRLTIARYPLADERLIRVQVWYPTVDGIPRRYYLSVQPVSTFLPGVEIETPSEGYCLGLDEALRFNARKLEALATDPAVLDMARLVVERVREDEAARMGARVGGAA